MSSNSSLLKNIIPFYYRIPKDRLSTKFVNEPDERCPVIDPTKTSVIDKIFDGNLTQTTVIKMSKNDAANTRLVGQDHHGNQYFENMACDKGLASASRGRWIIYADHEDYRDAPSAIPPEWHGWLNWIHNDSPTAEAYPKPFYTTAAQLTASGSDPMLNYKLDDNGNICCDTNAYRYNPKGAWFKGDKRRSWTKYSTWTPPGK